MKELVLAAAELQGFCVARGWEFCFIGGLAVQQWSELRATMDVDMTLLTGFAQVREFIDALLSVYAPRRPDAADFAERSRVLLLKTREGLGLDIAMGALPFEQLSVQRAVEVEMLPGHKIRVCTAEDLIVHKVFAARSKDWRDVEMTIVRQGEKALDWAYIHAQLRPLLELKEALELLDELEVLRERVRRQDSPER